MKRNLLSLFFLIVILLQGVHSVHAQNYNMSAGTTNTCSGNFYDNGGNGANYGNSQNITQTFCASAAGSCVQISFSSFSLENNFDFLYIYNGSNTSAPLIGTYTGNTSPGVVTATSGCITLRFTSDAIITNPGWAATISCVACPPPPPPPVCNSSCNGGPPPTNDPCSGAQNLGALPTPSPCPNGVATASVINTTNLCATPSVPYTSLQGCQPAGNQASPAADVWYRFTITAPVLNINLTGALNQPNIALYEGTSCNSMIPRGCAIGNPGSLATSFNGLAPGTYYLQVSGGNTSDQCNFSLSLQNNFDCAGCVIQSNLIATPPPVGGVYSPGQTVNFCMTISNYNQTSNNWLHGVVPSFGAGWNAASFVAVSSTNCSGAGTWSWYNTNVTSSATGQTTGPGFYYESALGGPGGVADNNPGNNYGDNNANNTCDWTFCWSIATDPNCTQGTDLNISVNTLGDGESGSWTSVACTGDPSTNLFATLTCCLPPTVTTVNPVCPGQNTGSATATGQGTGPWTYQWVNNAGTVISTQPTLNGPGSIANLAPGSYTVVVTDANNCSANALFTIGPANPNPYSAVINPTPISCAGGTNGAATVVVNGGAPAYSYAWSPSGGNAATAQNLSAGSYTVVVTDANGCTTTATTTITAPPLLTVTLPAQVNITCNGGANGSITAAAAGGTPNYTYSWSGGASGTTINGLTVGTYTVTVTDSRGCTSTVNTTLTQPAPIVLNTNSSPANCGSANGSASVTAAGGTPNYTYQWSPSGGASASASGLAAGTYNVTVTDNSGCTANTSVTVGSTTGPVASITASANVSCSGGTNGTATVTPQGGTAPFIYSWTPAGGNAQTAQNLPAGNYTVTITDASGCTTSAAVIITQPQPVTLSVNSNVPQSCVGLNNGSVSVQAGGGTPGYSYLWSNGNTTTSNSGLAPGSYTATVTDNNGCTTSVVAIIAPAAPLVPSVSNLVPVLCNAAATGSATAQATGGTAPYTYIWSNGAGSATASGLSAGTYSVTITDQFGCTAVTQATISEPPPIVIAPVVTSATCGLNNGSATANPSGGAGIYNYSWSPTGGNSSTASGLAPGSYSVIVTDNNGCTAQLNSISIAAAPGPQAIINSITDVSCAGANNGSASVSAVGGTNPVSILWSNGSSANTITGLAPGTYAVTLTDGNGCTSTTSATIGTAPPIVLSASPSIAHCGLSDGSINTSVTGGSGNFTYAWSDGSTNSGLTNVPAGSYTLTITDGSGCTAMVQATVANDPPPVMNISSTINPLCAGSSNGQVSLNPPAGGTAPYTYAWSNGNNGSSASGLPAGTYTATVTDANGCTAVVSATLTDPAPVQVTLTPAPSTCGQANGSVSSSASGGTGVISLIWSNGFTGASISGLTAGSYVVTATDANGCTATTTSAVADLVGPQIAAGNTTSVNCNGGSDGTATAGQVAGNGPFTYVWSPSGGIASTATGLSAGAYQVLVTDVNGCTITQTLSITQPPLLVLSPTSTPVLCDGGNTGTASVSGQGGTGGYSYQWSNGTAGSTATGLIAGSYQVTVSDANGCTAISSVQVTSPAALAVNPTIVNTNCFGSADGSVSLSASGGVGAYNYSWSSGGSTSTAGGLAAGTYTYTITDGNGCTFVSTATVSQPTQIVLQPAPVNAICSSANGSIGISGQGGTGSLTYAWSNGQSGSTASGLSAGSYTVTATDANGCTMISTIAISNLAEPVLAPGNTSDVSCNGGSDGSASVLVQSGNTPLTYSWTQSSSTVATAGALSAGTYQVTVTDVNGCTAQQTFTINQPPLLVASASSTPVLCNGGSTGSLSSSAIGGTGAYSYSWNNGAFNSTVSGIPAGNYQVTVTDANGCTSQASVQVTQPLLLTLSATPAPALCNGSATGSISLQAGGGVSAYSYLWNNGSTSVNQNNLPAGNYTATVTDANGCTQQVSAFITQPTPLVVQASSVNATCGNNNGTASVSGSGGSGIIDFSWSTGQSGTAISSLAPGTYTVTATDANGCTSVTSTSLTNLASPQIAIQNTVNVSCYGGNNGSVTVVVNTGNGPYNYTWAPAGGNGVTAPSLSAGTYTVTVTDVNGCTTQISSNVSEPSALVAQTTSNQATCGNANGSASVAISGGTTPYSYNWSQGTVLSTANNLLAGNYTVLVTDANGCTISASVLVATPPALAVQSSAVPALCNSSASGSAQVQVSGGTTPFAYSWSNGGITSNIGNLTAGSYTVTVTDANNCTAQSSVTVNQPSPIALQTTTTNAVCGSPNGSAQVSGNGGTGNITYIWSNGQSTTTISSLTAGTYTVTATDANGCTQSAVAAVNNSGGPTLASGPQSNVSCNGGNNGSATVSIVAGNGGYTYNWTPSGGNTATANGLSAGAYQVTVTDINGCIAVQNFTITEPALLTATVTPTAVSCNGGNNGSVALVVGGGTAPYNYAWSNGASSMNLINTTAGSYQVTVTDAQGCTRIASAQVTQPAPLSGVMNATNINCFAGNTGLASVNVSGGTAPYTYLWSNAATASGQNSIGAGTYTVTVTDANGCTWQSSASLTQPTAIILQPTTNDATCGNSNGSAQISGSGGTGLLSYAWSNGSSSSSISNILAGTYTVTATDANNCTAVATMVVSNVGGPQAVLQNSSNVSCNGGSDGSAGIVLNGGSGPFTINWLPSGGTGLSAGSLSAGAYTVNVTDANGCVTGVNVTITEPAAIVLQFTSQQASCGSANGSASVSAAGGTGSFSYSWSSGANTATSAGLIPGPYSVTVTDQNGCTAAGSVNVTSPSTLAVQVNSNAVSCNGGNNGSASSFATGGNPPYSFAWSSGATGPQSTGLIAGTYTVTVTDGIGCSVQQNVVVQEPAALTINMTSTAANCNAYNGTALASGSGGTVSYTYAWSNGAAGAQLNGLTPGTYTVTLTDANGCTALNTIAVAVLPGPSIDSVLTGNSACAGSAGGTAVVYPSGGVAPYNYSWSNGSSTAVNTGLLAGTYTVTVSDSYGCSSTQQAVVSQPQAMVLNAQSVQQVSCYGGNDGSASVQVTGGAPPYTYQWSNGGVSSLTTGLQAGTFTVVVTDFNGCTEASQVSLVQPTQLYLLNTQINNVTCFGLSNGSATVLASGGTPPYSYSWSNGSNTAGTSGLIAGVYAVTLTDNKGCITNSSVTITEPAPLLLQVLSVGDVTCFGGSDGKTSVSASGGNAPYAYSWSNGSSQAALLNLNAGTYTVVASDAGSCTATTQVTISQPATLPAVAFTPPDAKGCEPLLVQFGSPVIAGYTYQWNYGDNNFGSGSTPSHIYTKDGQYDVTLTVTDANGCTNSLKKTGIITVYPLPEAFFYTDPQQLTLLNPVVRFVNASTGANTVQWTFGDGSPVSTVWSPDHVYSDTGRYWIELIATSNKGCIDTFLNEIIIRDESSFWVPNAFTPNADYNNEAFTGYGIGITRAEFYIFDRWGSMVYQSDDLAKGWNGSYFNEGKECPEAVYVYLFRVYTGDPSPKEYKGRVSLVR